MVTSSLPSPNLLVSILIKRIFGRKKIYITTINEQHTLLYEILVAVSIIAAYFLVKM